MVLFVNLVTWASARGLAEAERGTALAGSRGVKIRPVHTHTHNTSGLLSSIKARKFYLVFS